MRSLREGGVELGVRAVDVEAVWIPEGRRIAVRAGQRESDEVAAADLRAGKRDVASRVPVDDARRRLEAKRFLHRVRDELGAPTKRLGDSIFGQDVPERVRDHAVGHLDSPEEQHRRIRNDLIACESVSSVRGAREERRLRVTSEGTGAAPPRASRPSPDGVRPALRSVTSATIARYHVSETSAGKSSGPSATAIAPTESGPESVCRRSAFPTGAIGSSNAEHRKRP